jgi:rubredoxin
LQNAPKGGFLRRNVLTVSPIAFGLVAIGKAKADDPRLDQLWRCGASECPGYVYDPRQGERTQDIPANTVFHDLPADFWCPECGAGKIEFFRVGDGVQWRTGLPD